MKLEKRLIVDLQENSYNPNELSPDKYSALLHNVKKYGLLQPILIRPNGVIIDGAHRVSASLKAGFTEIDCVVFETSDEEAKLLTLSMNNIKGENEKTKLKLLLDDLLKEFDEHQVLVETGLTDLNALFPTKKVQDKLKVRIMIKNIAFALTPKQYDVWLKAFDLTKNKQPEEALDIMCRFYLEAHK